MTIVTRILVVDDEPEICNLVKLYLEREGFQVDVAFSGEEALDCFKQNSYDMLIQDIMLPGIDGNEVVRQIRSNKDLPILMLSARDTDLDKAIGLGVGADDYLTKPFSSIELTARVKSHLRRYLQFGKARLDYNEVCTVGPLRMNLGQMRAWVHDREIQLTLKEYELLKLFVTHPGQVFTKAQIFEAVWGNSFLGDDNTVMVMIRRLRSKIEPDPANPSLICTVWSIGYRLEGGK